MSTLRTVVSALGHYESNVPLKELPPKALQLPLVRVRVEHTGLPALSNKIFGAE